MVGQRASITARLLPVGLLLLLSFPLPAGATTITLRSGNGAIGDPDSQITF